MSQHSAQRSSKSPWKRYGHPENCHSKASIKRQAPYGHAPHVERSAQELSSTPIRPQDQRDMRREVASLCSHQHPDPAAHYAGASERNAQLTENALCQLPVQGLASATGTCCDEAVEGEGPSDGSNVIDTILQQVKNMCADVEDRCRQKYEAMLAAKDAELRTTIREWAQQRSELLASDESKQSQLEQYQKEVSQLQAQLQLAEAKCTELTAEIANAATKQSTVISTMQSEHEKMLEEYNANFVKEHDRLKQYVEHLEKTLRESDEGWSNSAKAYQRTKVAFEEASKEWKIEKTALENRIGRLRSHEQIYFETNEKLRKRNSKLEEANTKLDNTIAKLLELADTSVDEELKKKAVAIVAASLQMFNDT